MIPCNASKVAGTRWWVRLDGSPLWWEASPSLAAEWAVHGGARVGLAESVGELEGK